MAAGERHESPVSETKDLIICSQRSHQGAGICVYKSPSPSAQRVTLGAADSCTCSELSGRRGPLSVATPQI